ncbi:apolipoprotein L2-like [Colossoma macropomum]|uniref:apolipoprotein L2-like n=1 Tax=Colossoma macropomum TaxID=42526 RepID=UPI001864FDEB|nr:apolipoprotein L2-like [Colossoma macropomum]
MTFLFNGKAQEFIDIYTGCRSRMNKFLTGLKETENKLDKLETGSRISTVTGSSVGVAGGALSITGLALVPVSGGLSLALTFTGIGLGVLSGITRVVTDINKMAKKKKHGKKANNIFESFKEDVDKVLDCLEQTGRSQRPAPHVDEGNIALGAVKAIGTTGAVVKGVKDMVQKGQALSAMDGVRTGKKLVCMGLKEAKVAQKIPIGDIVKVSSQFISKAARVGAVAINVLFIGIDLKTIYNECKNLDQGKKSKASQLIFSRSALWHSEMEAWEKIHDSLFKGKETFERNLEILDQQFYC